METLDPLTGHASLILPNVIELATAIISHEGIDTFKIGQTNHPMGHRNALRCVELFTVYKSHEPFDAKRVEAGLKEAFDGHPKWSREPDPDLAVSADMAQFVYLAVW